MTSAVIDMRAGQGWLRDLLATLAGALVLAACDSPDEPGHRVFGYVDSSGREVIAPQYRSALPFHEGLAAVLDDEGWGYIDTAGRWVIRPTYEAAGSFSNDRAIVLDAQGAWGYIDHSGKTVIPHRYRQAGDFIGERAIVRPDGDRTQVIDPNGEVIADLVLNESGPSEADSARSDHGVGSNWELMISRLLDETMASIHSERLIPVGSIFGGTGGYVDPEGHTIGESRYVGGNAFVEGRAQVCLDQKCGFIDRTGRLVVELKYDAALLRFSRDRTVAVHDDHAWIVDTQGRDVADLGAFPWPTMRDDENFGGIALYVGYGDFFADGVIPWQRDGLWGYVGLDGDWVIAPRFEMAHPFHAGRASVQFEGRGQLVDVTGRVVASVPRGWWIAPSGGDRPMVGTSTRWGFAGPHGELPQLLQYAATRLKFARRDFADARPLRFSDGLALVSRVVHHRWQVVDVDGRQLASARYDWVQDAGRGRYAVGTEGRWALAGPGLEILSSGRFDQPPKIYWAFERGMFIAQGDREGCLDWDGSWRSLPAGVGYAHCDGPLLAARLAAEGHQEGVLSRSDQWIVPPVYQYVTRVGGAGTDCFHLQIATSGDDTIARIACIDGGRPRYSEPRQTQCALQQVCFQRDASGWRRLDFGSMQPVRPAYSQIGKALDDYIPVQLGTRWGLLAASGRMRVPADYDGIASLYDEACRSAFAVRRGALVGVVDAKGREVLPLRYDAVKCLAAATFAVRIASRWGVVREHGEVVVPPRFDEILLLRDGLLLAKSGDTVRLETLSGEPLLDPAPPWLQRINRLSDFSAKAWAVFTLDRELYFIDKRTRAVQRLDPPSGHTWLPPNYVSTLDDAMYGVVPQGPSDFMHGFEPEGFSGHMYVRQPGSPSPIEDARVRAVVVDAEGRILPWLFDGVARSMDLPHGHYVVQRRGKCGVVDEHGRWPVPLVHDHCEALEDGLVLVGDEDD